MAAVSQAQFDALKKRVEEEEKRRSKADAALDASLTAINAELVTLTGRVATLEGGDAAERGEVAALHQALDALQAQVDSIVLPTPPDLSALETRVQTLEDGAAPPVQAHEANADAHGLKQLREQVDALAGG